MSRSTRRPFMAITSAAGAKDDKRLALRGVRRKQNFALRACANYENLLVPHQLECAWNDTWCWDHDGAQMNWGYLRFSADEWDKKLYQRLQRK